MTNGIILPPAIGADTPSTFSEVAMAKLGRWRNFCLLVVVPTLCFAAFQYLVASDRYETSSEFIVKSGDGSSASAGIVGNMLGLGVKSQSQTEILSVPDYLESHEVVSTLQRRVNLVQMFRRPEADLVARLWHDNPEPEELLKYYRTMVSVRHNADTGIMHMSVQAFRPEDALRIGELLLQLGERKINEMNQRSYEDAVKSARQQLSRAEGEVASIQRKITIFRKANQDIDPELSGASQIKLVSDLQARLATAKAHLNTMSGVISSDSPQYQALLRQVRSLDAEATEQAARMGSRNANFTHSLGEYEELKVRQDFASKNYVAAAANLQNAIDQAQKQQLYFVRVVDPNLPVKSLYPKREKSILTLFLFLTIAYGIGWLIFAGVREHEA